MAVDLFLLFFFFPTSFLTQKMGVDLFFITFFFRGQVAVTSCAIEKHLHDRNVPHQYINYLFLGQNYCGFNAQDTEKRIVHEVRKKKIEEC